MKTNRFENGFSLAELLLVIAIIGIIAAMAIPDLMSSRRAANEASALQSMRLINSAEHTYLSTTGDGTTYGSKTELMNRNLIDSVLGGAAPKSGYLFTVNPNAGGPPTYWAYALPSSTSGITQTGMRRFGITEDGVLRADTDLTAPADETAVKNISPIK